MGRCSTPYGTLPRIDAGGTKTDCAVSNGAELLGQASGASCKLARVGRLKAHENLQSVVQRTCDGAHVQASEVQHVCIGMAGASLPDAVIWAQETIREITPAATIYVAGDHVIAHRAAFGTSHGVLVISGTGSIAFGRNQKGETARAGGWGPGISDEGSAYWVGREAVIAALHAYDRGTSDGLLHTIAQCWKIAPEEVVRMANASEPRFAELAAPVAAAAQDGDLMAREIIRRAGMSLAQLAGAGHWPAVAGRRCRSGGPCRRRAPGLRDCPPVVPRQHERGTAGSRGQLCLRASRCWGRWKLPRSAAAGNTPP